MQSSLESLEIEELVKKLDNVIENSGKFIIAVFIGPKRTLLFHQAETD